MMDGHKVLEKNYKTEKLFLLSQGPARNIPKPPQTNARAGQRQMVPLRGDERGYQMQEDSLMASGTKIEENSDCTQPTMNGESTYHGSPVFLL